MVPVVPEVRAVLAARRRREMAPLLTVVRIHRIRMLLLLRRRQSWGCRRCPGEASARRKSVHKDPRKICGMVRGMVPSCPLVCPLVRVLPRKEAFRRPGLSEDPLRRRHRKGTGSWEAAMEGEPRMHRRTAGRSSSTIPQSHDRPLLVQCSRPRRASLLVVGQAAARALGGEIEQQVPTRK